MSVNDLQVTRIAFNAAVVCCHCPVVFVDKLTDIIERGETELLSVSFLSLVRLLASAAVEAAASDQQQQQRTK